MQFVTNKRIRFGTALLMLASLTSACSTAGTSNTSNSQAAEQAGSKPIEIEIMADLTLEVPSMQNEYWTEFQKVTNSKLNIVWVPGSEYETKLDLVLASGDIPEVIYGSNHNKPTLVNAIRQGAFWDLTPFLGDFSQYPNLRDNMTPGSWSYVKVDGKIMGVPRSRSSMDSGLKIRKDWLEKLKLPIPTNFDEYRDILIKITKGDPDGNGKNDTIGLAVGKEPDTSLQAAFGVFKPTYNEEGGLVFSTLTPQYAQLIEWLKGLYAEGVLPAEFAALNGSQLQDLVRSGRAASYHYAFYRDYTWTEDIRKVQPGGILTTLPPMKGPNGDYAAYLDAGTRAALHISKKVPEAKIKEILRFFDKTASKDITDLLYYGKEGVHFNMVNGEKVLTNLGKEQINVNNLSPITPAYSQWGKVTAPGAPKEWNDAQMKIAAPYEKLGVTDPFRYLISNTWIEVWPKYDSEMKSMITKAISGQISMDEFKKYVDKVKNDPQIKKAFKEFAADLSSRK